MKEIFKSPYTYIALFFIGRYYLKNKPDSSASKVIREITEGGENLLDETTEFVTDSVDIITETTEDIFGVVQEVGFDTQEALTNVVQGTEEAIEMADGDVLPTDTPDETPTGGEGEGEGEGSGFSGMRHNMVDDESTYYDGQPKVSSNLEKSDFSFSASVDEFNNNNPQMS